MGRKRYYNYHQDGELPEAQSNYYFVFGSNTRGAHGKGAALVAKHKYGAETGVGIGVTGNCFAIPTKDRFMRTLMISEIKYFIYLFKEFTLNRPDLQFWVTAVGCGLAGYSHAEIAPLFIGAGSNCNFPEPWSKFVEPNKRRASL